MGNGKYDFRKIVMHSNKDTFEMLANPHATIVEIFKRG